MMTKTTKTRKRKLPKTATFPRMKKTTMRKKTKSNRAAPGIVAGFAVASSFLPAAI